VTPRRRNSILIGVTFIVTGALYAGLAQPFGYRIEWAGVTMLGALGVALAILAYVLTAGSSD
jgi:hypothetical protein